MGHEMAFKWRQTRSTAWLGLGNDTQNAQPVIPLT